MLFLGGYYGVPALLVRWGVPGVDLSTSLDRAIPYRPVFAYAYALCYGQIFLPPLVAPDPVLFRHAVRAVAIVLIASFACFVVLPARMAYPPIGDAAGEWILRKNALFSDHGFNAFPSLHVALATFSATSIHHARPAWRLPVWSSTIGIALSTVMVKRHFVVDVPAGALLGWIVHRAYLTEHVLAWRAARLRDASS